MFKLLCIFVVNSSAVIVGHGCVETDNTYLNPGDSVTIYCFVNNTGGFQNLLSWTKPILVILVLSSVPSSSMGYTAAVVDGDNTEMTLNSSFSFIATKQQDDIVVTCRDNLNPPNEATCTVLVYSKSS